MHSNPPIYQCSPGGKLEAIDDDDGEGSSLKPEPLYMARKARPPTATAAMLLPKLLEAAPSKSAPEVDEGEADEVLLEPVG